MIFGYVYMKEEPGAHSAVIEPALRQLTETIGIPPRKMTETAAKPRQRGQRKFTWEWFGEAVPTAEAVSLWGGPTRKVDLIRRYHVGEQASTEELSVRFNLRYYHNIEMRVQQPKLVYAIVPTSDDPVERRARVGAVETFLLAVSAPSRPLHGGIAATVDAERAFEELHMSLMSKAVFGSDGKPVPHRLSFDSRHDWEFFTKARRAYWLTILGPELAAASGGVEAARATGAARVEMKGDCLVVQATDDINDSLATDWPARSAELRRWIWPHTIQNPADAPV